jgi:predicted TPR repeat methyltransferase
VVGAAARALRPGGLLIFTVEDSGEAEPSPGYRVHPHGRYSHHRDYVASVLRSSGLEPQIVQAELRTESGVPVAGLMVRGTKSRIAE